MSEQISSDFYKVPNVKIDILRLRTELEDVLKKKKFNTLGISHFGAISINRIPGDEESIKGHNTRGAYWTYPDEKGKEVAQKITKDTGCKTLFVKTDLPVVDQCRNAVKVAKQEFGKIDVLVNAAGITDRGNIVDTSEELFDKMIGVNLKGPYFLIQDTVKIMIEQNIQGSIINIGSVAAMTGQPFISTYCVSKGALATLTRNTAFALLKNKIRVNQLNIG